MSENLKSGAVLFAKDIARVAKFYTEIAGMQVVHSEAGLMVLESNHFQLIIHGIPKDIAESIVITIPPKRRSDTTKSTEAPEVSHSLNHRHQRGPRHATRENTCPALFFLFPTRPT